MQELVQNIPLATLEAMFEKTAVAVMGVNPAGRIMLWNTAATNLFGYDLSKALNRRCYELTQGEDVRGNLLCCPDCSILRMLRSDKVPNDYLLCTHSITGEDLLLNVSMIAINTDNTPLALHLFHDVRWITDAVRPQPEPSQPKPSSVTLTAREHEILGLMVNGHDSHEMASLLHISYATVRNHVQNILDKLGVHSRVEAVVVAMQERLTEKSTQSSTREQTMRPPATRR